MTSRVLIGKESLVIHVTRQNKASEAGHRLFFGGKKYSLFACAIPSYRKAWPRGQNLCVGGDYASKDNKVVVRREKLLIIIDGARCISKERLARLVAHTSSQGAVFGIHRRKVRRCTTVYTKEE